VTINAPWPLPGIRIFRLFFQQSLLSLRTIIHLRNDIGIMASAAIGKTIANAISNPISC
jgi:hypothetical protein